MSVSSSFQSAIVRPLTAQEEIYWQLTYTDQIHGVRAAHVIGATTPEHWRSGLDALQMRHPSLSVSIESPSMDAPGLTQPFLRLHGNKKIPLRVVSHAITPRWEAEVEREHSIPFESGEAPLARAVLIHGAESSVFILSVSHSISDGMSASFMVRDVLAAMTGQSLAPLAYPRSAEELLGVTPVAPAVPAEDTVFITGPCNDPPTFRTLRFTEALTQRVIALSRRERTTVHGALAAATALAMRQLIPRFMREPVRIISPVNVRSVLDVGDDCGMYFASPKTEFDPTQPRGFWDMARDARQNIVDGSTRESLVAATIGMQTMTAKGLTKAAAAEALKYAFAFDVLLTNLGQTPYASTFGELRLESMWSSVLAGEGAQTIGVTTTNGALCLALTARAPVDMLLETVQQIIVDMCV
jgi:hypothetical protein